jgi:hypothetical protein
MQEKRPTKDEKDKRKKAKSDIIILEREGMKHDGKI